VKRVFTIAAILGVLSAPVAADPAKHEAAFVEAKAEVNAFRADPKKRKFRHNFIKLTRGLERLSKEYAGTARGDDFLFVAAQLYEELYEASRVGADLELSVATYQQVATRFPSSNLADDALFRAARIALERQGDRARARALLEKVLGMDGADMGKQARELLARLPAPAPSETEKPTEAEAAKVDEILTNLAMEAAASEAKPAPIPQVEVLPEAPPAGTPARSLKLSHAAEGDRSVIRVRMSGAVGVVRGEAPATATRARRVFFDLTPAKLGRQALKPVDVNDGTVKRVRAGQYTRDTVRVVVELTGEVEPSLGIVKKPFQLTLTSELAKKSTRVAKLQPKAKAKDSGKVAKAAPIAPKLDPKVKARDVRKRLGKTGSPGGVSISQQIGLKVKRIVIDAGHGGRDTGAIGPTGVKEKNVTLSIARKTRARLKRSFPDVEVLMTRDGDKTLELSDRTNLANEKHADLFISIHANANPSRRVRGVETYYLNITHDRYAMRLAKRENEAHGGGGKSISDLQFILADLAMKSNVDDSIRLGRQVQRSLVGELREDYKSVQDLGLKHALFYVLMGARMPAILVETSFISNRTEEKRLKTGKYQDKVAEGIVLGVKRFLAERQAFHASR
jgi:N-acetylmuramoyl-L-alanine amidase